MATGRVSVILPVYNEGKSLERNVGRPGDFEIIISEDGSTDDTARIAESLESKRIRVLRNGARGGKGEAIRNAVSLSRGDIIIFMDADLASDPEQVEELAARIRGGAAIVIGSRYLPGSHAKRTPLRYFASRSFNWLVRALLGSRLSDHQCGFKAFRKDSVLPILDQIDDRTWFWDTELLVLAQRQGLKVAEVPIKWEEGAVSTFSLFGDTIRMAASLVAFKLKRG